MNQDENIVNILMKMANPEMYNKNFDDIVINSTLYHENSVTQMNKIVSEFNMRDGSIVVKSSFGKRIQPNEFRLVSLNQECEIVPPTLYPMRKRVYVNINNKVEELGICKQTDLFIGNYGSYIVNVPLGKIALAWKGNNPIFLGPGPHVIHDQNLKRITEQNLVDYNSQHIIHGTFNIIRVDPNYCATIRIGTVPYFLTPNDKPYVFDHIVQVPQGKIAKVWVSSTKALLLEANSKPYVFNDRTFKFDKKNDNELFEDATNNIILHGSIKRLLPKTGQVAVTYNAGKLITFKSTDDGKPICITADNHVFDNFITTNIQTIQFPSENTKMKRKRDDKNINADDDNYDVFRTSDGLPIGVKLLVIYEINRPELTLAKLNPNAITPHIEHIVTADMGLVIQNCSSTDFLKSNQSATQINEKKDVFSMFYEELQTRVFNKLKEDFDSYGINLVRLSIETPKILDQMISKKMAEFSLINSESRAKESAMERNFNIAKQQATQEATTKQIQQDQENQNKISKAQAEFQSAKLEADGTLVKAEASIKVQERQIEISKKRAELFDKHPGLLQFELAQVNAKSMEGIKSMIISPEIAKGLFGMPFIQRSIEQLNN